MSSVERGGREMERKWKIIDGSGRVIEVSGGKWRG